MPVFADTGEQFNILSGGENPLTLEELHETLPNGFHDAEIFSFELDYVAAIAKFHLNLLVGWPDDPESEGQAAGEPQTAVFHP
jgi:hypothetical protein